MAKNKEAREYGAEIGEGVKKGMQGLNTVCSPKKRKTCIRLILIPLILFIALLGIGASTGNDSIGAIGVLFGLCLGLYQFYVGKILKGIIYTISCGGIVIGCLIDLFKLVFTKTFKDANGFPLIY